MSLARGGVGYGSSEVRESRRHRRGAGRDFGYHPVLGLPAGLQRARCDGLLRQAEIVKIATELKIRTRI